MQENIVLQRKKRCNMAVTFEPLATTTLTATSTTITFSSISGSYTDLRLVVVAGGTADAATFRLRFNSDTGSNYSSTILYGDGTNATSTRYTNDVRLPLSIDTPRLNSTIPSLITIDLLSYAGSTNKTVLSTMSLDRNGSGAIFSAVGMWRSTSAITNIEIITTVESFTANTTASLYGILKA